MNITHDIAFAASLMSHVIKGFSELSSDLQENDKYNFTDRKQINHQHSFLMPTLFIEHLSLESREIYHWKIITEHFQELTSDVTWKLISNVLHNFANSILIVICFASSLKAGLIVTFAILSQELSHETAS
ncbi:uncharacterized protein LOC118199723 isoform X2 [Stegodyphus dumicola]|uniref:uncharacterized protein LOC118199723 isoform X2 n=1 Tax=Stegodyphus dumicola TaxID=202533 RepID=UPI0015ABA305|nr:uncharacterized protein LOC118199723 isoform X2 [Stegodyphus dumicola]